MEKKIVIKATEREILDLVNKHFDINTSSIVDIEELGNQEWVVEITPYARNLAFFVDREANSIMRYCFSEALDQLCFDGVLEAGEYIIDCTW